MSDRFFNETEESFSFNGLLLHVPPVRFGNWNEILNELNYNIPA